MSTIVNPRQALRIACIALLLAVPALAASDRNVAAQSKSDAPKAKHAKAALDGYCPVCITKIKKWVRGDPQHQAAHNGKTYWFPGEKQKRMFLADPAKYIPALDGDCTDVFLSVLMSRHRGRVGVPIAPAAQASLCDLHMLGDGAGSASGLCQRPPFHPAPSEVARSLRATVLLI